MSKRRSILEAVKRALACISTADGYNLTLAEREPHYGLRSLTQITSFPAVDFYLADETDLEYHPDGQAIGVLELEVFGLVKAGRDDDDLIVEDFLADIVKAMHADHTLEGTAIDCTLTDRSVDPYLDGNELPRVCSASFKIKYQGDYGSL